MKAFLIVAGGLLAGLLAAAPCRAHGVEGFVEQVSGYCVTARYDDGEPMNYAAVEIKAPDSPTVFQTGKTDPNGCFMLLPDKPGRWQAVVNDGMGHRLALDFEVSGSPAAARPAEAGTSGPVAKKSRSASVVAGLAIIFGISGMAYGWQARRRTRSRG